MPDPAQAPILFLAVRPTGEPMRVVSGASVRDCWNALTAESGLSIAELKRAGWRVRRDGDPAP